MHIIPLDTLANMFLSQYGGAGAASINARVCAENNFEPIIQSHKVQREEASFRQRGRTRMRFNTEGRDRRIEEDWELLKRMSLPLWHGCYC